jgi:hypothetical protein
LKLLFQATRHSRVRWKTAIAWKDAMAQFTIMFGDRLAGSTRGPRQALGRGGPHQFRRANQAAIHDRFDGPDRMAGDRGYLGNLAARFGGSGDRRRV